MRGVARPAGMPPFCVLCKRRARYRVGQSLGGPSGKPVCPLHLPEVKKPGDVVRVLAP